jgi:UDP-N-acetylglucosamine/UDP-N-acetyl-alpha-D-glucosaminouronate 4-epimerase
MALYLVTGAAGFIGSSLCRALLAQGHSVRGLDNLSTGKRENLADVLGKMELREADLLDPKAVASAVDGADYILHQAALPSVPRSVADPEETNRHNVNGTLNLLIAARSEKQRSGRNIRVVYAASSSAYGDTPTLPKREDMFPNPISPYAVSKLTGELYMQSFWRVYGLETVSLRYFNIFGPRQDANSQYSAVLAKFITRMLRDERPIIFGDGEQSRDFNFIDNCIQANIKAATAPAEKACGQVFNVACGKRFTLNETVDLLNQILSTKLQAEHQPERAGDIKHSLADISKAEELLGYRPDVGFEEGLKRTVAWYREQQ